MTLVGFLRARIDEDEHTARASSDDLIPEDCWSPARVLGECEWRRAVIDQYESAVAEHDHLEPATALEAVLKAMATPYEHHPDYRQEWRP